MQWSPASLALGTSCVEDNFPRTGVGGMVQDDSIALHLVCTLFLFLLHQLHLTSAGVRFWRLGTTCSKTSTYSLAWNPILGLSLGTNTVIS